MKWKLLVLIVTVFFIGAAQAKANISPEKLKLATVIKEEGVEHSFIRQLKSDPKFFGYSGDLKLDAEITKWAENQAHKFAIKFGYFDPKFYGEVRVSEPDKVAFILEKDKDGNLSCREFVKDNANSFPNSPERSIKTVGNEIAEFLAHEDESGIFVTGVYYEYFQLPVATMEVV